MARRIGNAYEFEITSDDGYVMRTHYVDHSVKKSDRVKAEQIGIAQDITQRYSDVPHHVHFEMRNTGKP